MQTDLGISGILKIRRSGFLQIKGEISSLIKIIFYEF